MERMRENTIDFGKVVTKEDLAGLSSEEIEFAKKEGRYHAVYLRNYYNSDILSEILTPRAREVAFLGHKYRHQSDVVKELLAANIVFPNDEQFIKILLSRDINYYQLINYARAISSTKKVALYAKNLEADDNVRVISRKLNGLCNLVKSHTGIKDFNLILTKINEIVLFQKDLYKQVKDCQDSQKRL